MFVVNANYVVFDKYISAYKRYGPPQDDLCRGSHCERSDDICSTRVGQ